MSAQWLLEEECLGKERSERGSRSRSMDESEADVDHKRSNQSAAHLAWRTGTDVGQQLEGQGGRASGGEAL